MPKTLLLISALWLSPAAITCCFCTFPALVSPLAVVTASQPAQPYRPSPYSQAFGVPGSHIAQSGAYSSVLTDFCLEYTLEKHRRFIHIRHSQPE